MPPPLTKSDLKALHDAVRAEMRQTTKDIIADQRTSLRTVSKELHALRDQVREGNTKLDAIMTGDVLVTREQLVRLLEKLNAQGVTVDEREIFAT